MLAGCEAGVWSPLRLRPATLWRATPDGGREVSARHMDVRTCEPPE